MENKTKGSGLIFAVVLLFVILGMVITLSSITVLETKMNQKTKSSVGAFYNSESGVEWALNKIATGTGDTINQVFSGVVSDPSGKITCPLPNCEVYLLGADGKVIPQSQFSVADSADLVKAVRSVGSQNGETQRAIEAAVAASGDYQISCWHVGASAPQKDACVRINTSTGVAQCVFAVCDSDTDPCLGGNGDGTPRSGYAWQPCGTNPF